MRIFNFVVLPLITAPHNAPTTHISNIHLLIVSINVRELELNWCSKDQLRKMEVSTPAPTQWKANSPPQTLRFIKQSSLSS